MIRAATADDASRLAEILIFAKRAAYRPIFQNDIVSFCEMQVLDLALSYQRKPDTLEDVYVYDDAIVKGMMRWKRESSTTEAWELKELYIDPFFQHQGIGHQMASRFLSAARENGAPTACLWVLEKNLPARGFYERLGFWYSGVKQREPGTMEYILNYTKKL